MQIDLYHSKEQVEKQLMKLEEHKRISAKNKALIKKFYESCIDEDLSDVRIEKYLRYLRQIAIMLKKDFNKATEEDLKKVIRTVKKEGCSAEGKEHDYKVTIKKFYKWINHGEYPAKVKAICTTIKNNNHRLPEDLLTEKEVQELINNARLLRDKAIISMLYESGCRIGEILTLKRKNVQFDSIGAVLIVDGKTGQRRVRLISSVPYLMQWYSSHPLPNDPEAALFLMETVNNPLPYDAVRMMLKRVAKKAGIKKKVNPHSFRHARATFLANKLTEAQLKDYLGWTQNSKMAATYVHLSGRDTDEAIQRIYGIKKEPQEEKSILSPKKCPRCDEVNAASAKYCKKCWLPLDIKTAIEVEKRRKESDKVMRWLFQDEEVRKLIEKKLERMPQRPPEK